MHLVLNFVAQFWGSLQFGEALVYVPTLEMYQERRNGNVNR